MSRYPPSRHLAPQDASGVFGERLPRYGTAFGVARNRLRMENGLLLAERDAYG